MAFLGTSVLLNALSISDAEKAFRPWWDTIEDHIVYTIVILGILVAPTSVVLGFNMDCTYCIDSNCGEYGNIVDDPGMNTWFVRRYCAFEGPLSPFILYFPFIILLAATVLIMVDRPFVHILFNSHTMEELHRLLIVDDPYSATFDKNKEIQELNKVKYFVTSNSYFFFSYFLRTVISLVASVVLIVLFVIYRPRDNESILICPVHDYWYECTGHPVQFYQIVVFITISLLCVYLLLNVYNLAWLFIPQLGKLRRVMATYKRSMDNNSWDSEVEQIYFKSWDTQLLLNMLAMSQGIAVPMRSLALLDKDFNSSCMPNIQNKQSPEETLSVCIKEGSVLSHIQKRSDIRLGFQIEIGVTKQLINFTSNLDKYEAKIPWMEQLEGGQNNGKLITLVNGKIIAVRQVNMDNQAVTINSTAF